RHAAGRSARQAQLRRAVRPGAVTTVGVAQLGCHRDLLLPGGLVRVLRVGTAAVGVPGALVELQAAVVAVAGVDRPVAAGFALGQPIPDARVVDLGADPDHPLLGFAQDLLVDLLAGDLHVVLLG